LIVTVVRVGVSAMSADTSTGSSGAALRSTVLVRSGCQTVPSNSDSVATRRYGTRVPSVRRVSTVAPSWRRRSLPRSSDGSIIVEVPNPAAGTDACSVGPTASAAMIATAPIAVATTVTPPRWPCARMRRRYAPRGCGSRRG
jgi:hypothetical protein